jgi:hypothetical protein
MGFGMAVFVTTSLVDQDKVSKLVLFSCLASFVLFPITINKNFQNFTSHMTPYDISAKNHLENIKSDIFENINLFSEHKKISPAGNLMMSHITPRRIFYRNRLVCEGTALLLFTERIDHELRSISMELYEKIMLGKSSAPVVFDNGIIRGSIISDCANLNLDLAEINLAP